MCKLGPQTCSTNVEVLIATCDMCVCVPQFLCETNHLRFLLRPWFLVRFTARSAGSQHGPFRVGYRWDCLGETSLKLQSTKMFKSQAWDFNWSGFSHRCFVEAEYLGIFLLGGGNSNIFFVHPDPSGFHDPIWRCAYSSTWVVQPPPSFGICDSWSSHPVVTQPQSSECFSGAKAMWIWANDLQRYKAISRHVKMAPSWGQRSSYRFRCRKDSDR